MLRYKLRPPQKVCQESAQNSGHVNRLSLKQMCYLWGGVEDAIASSDITKAPFVKQCTERYLMQCHHGLPDIEDLFVYFSINVLYFFLDGDPSVGKGWVIKLLVQTQHLVNKLDKFLLDLFYGGENREFLESF